MTADDFEDRYRQSPDPWNYQSSSYEQRKYRATLSACGSGPFNDALELGASIGVFTALLAPRCQRLTTVDFAPSAVATARRRLHSLPQVEVLEGRIPEAVPERSYDLIVASEILYYLEPGDLQRAFAVLAQRATLNCRLVAVHWREPGPERPGTAADVHSQLRALPWLRPVGQLHDDAYLLDVLERLP